jgi:hypothetical protein
MKSNLFSKPTVALPANNSPHPTCTTVNRAPVSPFPHELQLKLTNCPQTMQLETTTKQEDSSSDLESNHPLLTNRTAGPNSFEVTNKSDTSIGAGKSSSNIRSYLRMKPCPNVSFLPFEVDQDKNIVCDRAVYKFDQVFQPGTGQV